MLFVSGSRSVARLPKQAKDALDKAIAEREMILVGDCTGADLLVQRYCHEQGYYQVRVYHIGSRPRNCLGFVTVRVLGNAYADKDIRMSKDADRGLAIWDGVSTGTARNIARMHTVNKPITVIRVQ